MIIDANTNVSQLQTYCDLECWILGERLDDSPVHGKISQITIHHKRMSVTVTIEAFDSGFDPGHVYLDKSKAITVYNDRLEQAKL